ncbi:uncharacterized protein LOC113370602 isoform X2 [Ctenocephalides felis]|uniref:uncharacterized protein LOC113370602 isoform X2 n=1 Tax=Ctenocephalides felis TaxID=7515 RepID=UPI000E6E583E|nr:uncharacterized protein LOC113370602 isoform X2 [Ctenocephalides felis]
MSEVACTVNSILTGDVLPKSQCLSSAYGQVWTWKNKEKTDDPAIKMYAGLISLVEDFGRVKSYHLEMFCTNRGVCLCSFPLEELAFVNSPEDFLDIYETKERMVCVNYTDNVEKEIMKKAIDKANRKTQRAKKDLAYAKRNEDIYLFFEQKGIKECDIIDTKTRAYIFDLMQNNSKKKLNADKHHRPERAGDTNSNEDINRIDEILSELVTSDQLNLRSSLRRNNSLKRNDNAAVKMNLNNNFYPKLKTETVHETKSSHIKMNHESNSHTSQNGINREERKDASQQNIRYDTQKHVIFNSSPKSDSVTYSTISHFKVGDRKLPNKSNDTKDDSENLDYADIAHDYSSMPRVMETKAKFMQKIKDSSGKSDTLPLNRTQAPPIPPKLKRSDSRPDLVTPVRPTVTAALRTNYENYFPKPEDKVAPTLPRKIGKLAKENIGSPENFKHIGGFSKWD